ncbi:MAG: dimethylarginine dimethylaminohydrolase family protein [Candidatus Aminicenantales bacterium]
MLTNEGHRLARVVVCSPGKEYFGVSNLKAHNILEKADPQKAGEQHKRLKTVIAEFGAEVIDADELGGHPNSVFTRDTSLCTPQGYIHLRMGLATRRGEEEWMAEILDGMDEPQAAKIHPPGTVEGGDIILAGGVAFIGHSRRTNKEGVLQVSGMLKKMGYEVRIAAISPPHLHLGGLMSLVGEEHVLCSRGFFEDDFFRGFDLIEVECEMFVSANVICLGEGELIAEVSNTIAVEALEKRRFKVHTLDLSEFIKGQGGPSCLILPVSRVA